MKKMISNPDRICIAQSGIFALKMSILQEVRETFTVEDFIENTFDPLLKRYLRFNKGKQFTMRFDIESEGMAHTFRGWLQEALKIASTNDRYKGLTFSEPWEVSKVGYSGNPQYPCRDVTVGYDVSVTVE